ncbi:hypothetical protein BD410DRAFT_844453 [Rickenella mellea]|uniref:Uncharacterized protein n=1 Tax=Rickenella mellea TaxID=50990 RepID=A0A4Y7PPA6_9AGAM|nr:hypothetical protein BD410DRAFT_844453 [Rickenella mellea]
MLTAWIVVKIEIAKMRLDNLVLVQGASRQSASPYSQASDAHTAVPWYSDIDFSSSTQGTSPDGEDGEGDGDAEIASTLPAKSGAAREPTTILANHITRI